MRKMKNRPKLTFKCRDCGHKLSETEYTHNLNITKMPTLSICVYCWNIRNERMRVFAQKLLTQPHF